jgi:hypothetical protein
VQFSVSSIQVIEDVGLANVTVLRTGGSTGTLTVDYATVDGTAIAGQDYTATSGTLTFNGGETSKTFQVPITDDAPNEPDETFTIILRHSEPRYVGRTQHVGRYSSGPHDSSRVVPSQYICR